MSQGLILIESLSSACWEKNEKKRKERKRDKKKWLGAFFPGLDTPCWLCRVGFSWLLGESKL
jgi:hypothetical protein